MIGTGTSDDARAIEARLLAALRHDLPQGHNETFTLVAHDEFGQMIGGLTAVTAYGWLLIKTLWVQAERRGRGLGAALMAEAERRGRALACHGAWLDTSNPAALPFYQRLGYQSFGELANGAAHHPASHRRWFLRRDLQQP